MGVLQIKIDFKAFLVVENANCNGDPLNGNMPRTTYDGYPLTPMGLAGMGDLVATCTSRHSRNRTFGEALARGETLEEFEARTHTVVEGARAAESVLSLAREHGVEVPISSAVRSVLREGVNVLDATDRLLGRRPGEEFYGIADQEKGRG